MQINFRCCVQWKGAVKVNIQWKSAMEMKCDEDEVVDPFGLLYM